MNLVAVSEGVEKGKGLIADIGSMFGPSQAFQERDARKRKMEPIIMYWRAFPKDKIPPERLQEFEDDLGRAREWWFGGTSDDLNNFNAWSRKWELIAGQYSTGQTIKSAVGAIGGGGGLLVMAIAAGAAFLVFK